ncbi:putative UDP-glucuronosyl/UDP-glucosyltransferase, UDP-glycosyltransferase family [Helianthus debilis subsp. tardiflorus]
MGIKCMNTTPTPENAGAVIRGMMILQTTFEQVIRDLARDCIFSDMFFPWTVELADELNIPRLLFYPSCFLYHSISHSLRVYKPHESVNSESKSFVIPNLPDKIMMKRSQLSEHFKTKTRYGEFLETIQQSEKEVTDWKVKDTKMWHIGPLFQFFVGEGRENGVSDKHGCLSWLDDQKLNSVIFACFGSMVKFPEAQITEIALALEESKCPFIWVVGKMGSEGIGGLPDGFEEIIKSKNIGLVITGWAPQVEILQHPAVGGFLTHCGWNSVLEAVVFGVPLITWPLYAEHFYNEKLVELLGINVRVGADVWNLSYDISSPIIENQGIIEAIELLISESVKAESIRQNSKKLAMTTKKVVEKGGSSVNSLTALIEELKAVKLTPKP